MVDLTKSWAEMSEKERLHEQWLNGDFDKYRLIRFGYLSVVERRRLQEKYGDLDQRFEPEPSTGPLAASVGIFVVLLLGIFIGGLGFEESTWEVWVKIILGSILYWVLASCALKDRERGEQERTERYWEWRGYKCDKYGRKM
jgi:hypothetical protein